jgi:hypothetical protein
VSGWPGRAASNGQDDALLRNYRRPASTELLTCGRCGANYLDDAPGRSAHRVVFGHPPKVPERTEEEPHA